MRPSDTALRMIEKMDKKKYLPTQDEMKEIKEVKNEEKEKQRKEKIERIRRAAQLQGVMLKKRAKGPNPMSIKKKKKVGLSEATQNN